jgi:hypothetical protein
MTLKFQQENTAMVQTITMEKPRHGHFRHPGKSIFVIVGHRWSMARIFMILA